MADQLFSAPAFSATSPLAVVTGVDHFVGNHLAVHLLTTGISVLGIPYCLDVPVTTKLPLPDSPNFQFHSLSDLQSSTSASANSNPLTPYTPLNPAAMDQYIRQVSTPSLVSQPADYLFLTDTYAASHSPTNLTSAQFSLLQQHTASVLTAFRRPTTKINFILPFYHLDTDSSPYPFYQVDYRHFFRQIAAHGLSNSPTNFRLSLLVDCYGPGLPPNSQTPLSQILAALRSRRSPRLPIAGQTRLYPLHVSDAVAGITKATFSLHTSGSQFLFAAPRPITVTTLLSQLTSQSAGRASIHALVAPPPLSSLVPVDLLARTRSQLHWRPQINFYQSFAQLLTGGSRPQPTSLASSNDYQLSDLPAPGTASGLTPNSHSSQASRFPFSLQSLRHPSLNFRFSLPRSLALAPLISIITILLVLLPFSLFGFSVVRSSLMFRQSYQSLRTGQLNQAANQAEFAHQGFQSLSRGVALFSFLNYLPFVGNSLHQVQTQFQLAELSSHVLSQSALSLVLLQETIQDSLDSNSNRDPRITLSHASLELSKTQYLLALLQAQLPDKLPFYLSHALAAGEYQRLREFLPHGREKITQLLSALSLYDQAAGFGTPQTYMLLLQNNRELRPTGGFIGSFALFTLDKGHLSSWKIYDVYQADGQLQGHVEPPLPLHTHLGEANWYLRDSNWDPDFPTTSNRVQWFLNKELNQHVAGVFAVDVDFINSLVADLDSVEIPDLQTRVTADNFYETTQRQAQANSFAGSHQKSDYLSSLADAVMYKLQHERDLNWIKLSTSIFDGLEQKHLLLHFNQPATQLLVADQGWDGAIASSAGAGDQVLGASADTLKDQLFVVEANLGVNKANNYVDRSLQHTVDLTNPSLLTETLQFTYTNNSTAQNPLAGDYKNYLRLYLPSAAKLQNVLFGASESSLVSLDEQSIDTSAEHGRGVFGFLITIPQQTSQLVKVTYTLPSGLASLNQAQYHLELLKQPGTQADPYQLTVKYPANFTPTNSSTSNLGTLKPGLSAGASAKEGNFETNFTLTPDHTLTYNTTISKDQTFNISFIKEKIKSL